MKQTSAGKRTPHTLENHRGLHSCFFEKFLQTFKWISGIYNMPENPIASFITPLSRFTRYQPTVPSNGQAIRA